MYFNNFITCIFIGCSLLSWPQQHCLPAGLRPLTIRMRVEVNTGECATAEIDVRMATSAARRRHHMAYVRCARPLVSFLDSWIIVICTQISIIVS